MLSNTRRVSPSASGNLRPHWTSWGALAAFGLLKLYCYILSWPKLSLCKPSSSCRFVTLLGNEVLLFQRSSLFEETGVVQNAAQLWNGPSRAAWYGVEVTSLYTLYTSILEAQENMKDISKTHSWPGFQSLSFGQNWIAASRFSTLRACHGATSPGVLSLIIFIHIQIISSIRDFHVSVHFLRGSWGQLS